MGTKQPTPAPEAERTRLRVLVVDDENSVRNMLKQALEQSGFSVRLCGNPLQAEEAAAEFAPDAFMIDLMMPDLTGIELCERLRAGKRFSGAVIIMMTGKVPGADRGEAVAHGLAVGADDYLLKPFDVGEVVARLHVRLEARRERQHATTRAHSAERAQRAASDRAEHYLHAAGVMLLALDSNGRVTMINRKGLDILGYGEREVVGQIWFDTFIPEQLREGVRTVFDQIVSGETRHVKYYENPIVTADGEERLIAWHNSLVRDQNGHIVGVLGSGEDITDKRRAAETLSQSEKRFRRLFEQSNDAIFIHTLDGQMLEVNERACELLGYDRENLLKIPLSELHPVEDQTGALRAIRNVRKDGRIRFETRLRCHDGTLVDVDINARLIDRELGLVQGVARDITERKRLQEEQRAYAERLEREVQQRTEEILRAQARYRALFEDVDHAIITTDPEGYITSCNRAAEQLIDKREQEAVGNLICAAMCGRATCHEFESILSSLKSTGTIAHECTMLRDGEHLPIHCAAAVVRGEEGRAQGLTWAITDISEQERLEEEVRRAHEYAETVLRRTDPQSRLIGKGRAHHKLVEFISMAADAPSPVLILGESGTGKEVAARAVHFNSPRTERPFVILDCAALKGELLESELFGHEQGAFTGAIRAKSGLIEVADGGTLFVDEVGEMPLELQSKLLRVLERGEYRRLGSTADKQANIRVVAATNRDLSAEVRKKRFRKDLFFRINVLSIILSPLRDRREDIPLLARHFVEHNRITMAGKKRIQASAMHCLEGYNWPGNVRELANVIERALILAGKQSSITPAHLPEGMRSAKPARRTGSEARSLADAEKTTIENALSATDWHRTHTAEILGITRKTLREKMKRYGIEAT
jgi:PAS domain S-box-containing protein